MTEDFEVGTGSLRRLIHFLIVGGVHGLFVLGSSSEKGKFTNAIVTQTSAIGCLGTTGRTSGRTT
jgi:hypothetical protein